MKNIENQLTDEYVLGLIDGEGCFSYGTTINKKGVRQKMPSFFLGMHERDYELIVAVRDYLGLNTKVHIYKSWNGDGEKRGRKAVLAVRKIIQLKNIIVPFFYKRLRGYKRNQFDKWIKFIGSDPAVPFSYQKISLLVKAGFYDDYLKTGDLSKIRDFE